MSEYICCSAVSPFLGPPFLGSPFLSSPLSWPCPLSSARAAPSARLSDHSLPSHAERHHEDVTRHDRTHLVGLCSGLFAAFAISIAPSLSALVPVGVHTVLLAFRTGSYVHTLGQRLSSASVDEDGWTYVFPGLTAEVVVSRLAEFQDANVSIDEIPSAHPQPLTFRHFAPGYSAARAGIC